MIINKKGINSILNPKISKSYLIGLIFKKFSITKLNINNGFLQNKLSIISPQTENIQIEFNLHNIKENNLQINIIEVKEEKTNEQSNREDNYLNSDDYNSIEKLFDYKFEKDKNKIIISNKPFENKEDDIQINLLIKANLLFNIKRSKRITISAISLMKKNNINKNLFETKENMNSFKLSCEESKIDITNTLIYSNIFINAIKSEIKCESLYAFQRKPFTNFKLFEESFLKTNQIMFSGENSMNETTQLKNNSDINQLKDISIIADNSQIEIDKIKNFNRFFLRTNEVFSNSIKINYIEISNFDIELNNSNDKLKINLYHLFENSIFKMKNIDFKNINIKLHPMLLFNLNVFNTNKEKFQKHLIFENEGYSFCPTIVFEIDKEFPKNYLVGYELIKISKYFKWFMYVIFLMFFTKIILLSDNCLENYNDFDANLNTLDNLPRQISEYKFYQLAVKKKFDKLLEKIER